MKAISTVIAIVLIVLIVIILSALIYVFLFGILIETTETGTVIINKTAVALSSCMYVESAAENKVYLRNCGKGVIAREKLAVYIDGTTTDFETSSDFVYEDDLMVIILNELWRFPLVKHNLRITSPYVQASRNIEILRSDSKAVLAFKFDEGSGTTAFDSSDCGNDGTLKDSDSSNADGDTPPIWVNGKFGEGLQFDGVDDYVGVLHNDTLDIGDKNFTIEAWIKTSSTSSLMAIADIYTESGDVDIGWLFSLDEGRIKLHIGEDSSNYNFSIGSSDLRDGLWHYVFGNYNKSHIQVYVDGVLEGIQPYTGDIWYGYTGGDVLNIAARCDACSPQDKGWWFDGIIDEVRIYDMLFNPHEVVTLKLRI